MKTLAIILSIVLSACTTYSVKRDGEGMVSVDVSSTRSFEQPNIYYKRQGSDAEFTFSADSVDSNIEHFTNLFQGVMSIMLQLMQAQMATNE